MSAEAMVATNNLLENMQGKYLMFCTGNHEYGLGVRQVREIIGGMLPVTPIPRTRNYVRGIINLRGKIIPVIDLRLRLGLPGIPYHERTCIIISEIFAENSRILAGIIVEQVKEVLFLTENMLERTPAMESSHSWILCLAKINGQLKTLIDIDHLINAEELVPFSETEDSAK
ncbi:MAG: purine-binding chemotaxis protein CheW [SAR324 cluster bacterium]|nr:purine-binding chemotaxis protein CheW [SAR324 cluster bacterium]